MDQNTGAALVAIAAIGALYYAFRRKMEKEQALGIEAIVTEHERAMAAHGYFETVH